MNILFVCSANKDRSKTADDYFSESYSNHTFDSAGTNKKICIQLGTNYIYEEQLKWADVIYVMEQKHYKAIKEAFKESYSNKISVLNIKDIYKYGSKELINILNEKVCFNSI
jgi:predicted protein tyrosine phosphatase